MKQSYERKTDGHLTVEAPVILYDIYNREASSLTILPKGHTLLNQAFDLIYWLHDKPVGYSKQIAIRIFDTRAAVRTTLFNIEDRNIFGYTYWSAIENYHHPIVLYTGSGTFTIRREKS